MGNRLEGIANPIQIKIQFNCFCWHPANNFFYKFYSQNLFSLLLINKRQLFGSLSVNNLRQRKERIKFEFRNSNYGYRPVVKIPFENEANQEE